MSANVDQRSKGQPNQVSNGSGKDVMKEDDPYLQAPVHPMRSWSDQTSDNAYGAPPMSTAGVSDSFFQNYYASNMTYPFMNQGLGASEGPWSNGADTMFGMGYDYSSMYGTFGFPPFNNWEYASEYWGSSQPQRKDQRGGYPPHQEEAYYPPEMIPADTYGMMANGVAPVPPEPQEPIGTVEHGLRGMSLGGGAGPMPSSSASSGMVDSGRKKMGGMDISHQPPNMSDAGFGVHQAEPSHLMMQHPPPLSHHQQHPQSQPSSSSMMSSGGVGGGIPAGHSQPKKTSWAAIASAPARTQQQLRPRTIPRAPVNPNKPHSGNMDIGTWDNRGQIAGKLPVQALQPPPSVSQAPPPPRAQSWAASSAPPPRATRQVGPPSTSNSNPSPGSGPSINSNTNNSSGNNASVSSNGSGAPGPSPNAHPSQGYSNYRSGSSSGHGGSGGGGSSTGNNSNNSSSNGGVSATMNGSHMSGGNSSRDCQQVASGSSHPVTVTPTPVVDHSKFHQYNPKEFNLKPKSARFFIIKSYSEDDIHRSIKYNIWCSTEHGNKRLDQAFREREGKGPVYLLYSVNGSGHFCGIAQMMSPVDYNKSAGVWAQDKWKGQFTVKWVYVKDVPNSQLRHIRLENNENKPVTNSRDTQEVPPEKGKQVLRILHTYRHCTSIFDDFVHYEKRQLEDAAQAAAPAHHSHGGQHRGGGDHRTDHRDHRGGDRGDRADGMAGRNNRDNRRGGYDMGGRGGQDHRDGGNRGHDHRGGGHHDNGGRGSRQN